MITEKKEAFNSETLKEWMERREEPLWLRRRRIEAMALYEAMDFPSPQSEEWRRTDQKALPLDAVEPFLPEDKAVLPAAPQLGGQTGGAIHTHNSSVVSARLDKVYADRGVVLSDLFSACDSHPEIIQKHFMTDCISPADSKYAALHCAFWNNGVFLYVPPGIELELPLAALADAAGDRPAFFHHTLIVVEKGSKVAFVEEFRSGEAVEKGYASRFLEIKLGDAARLDYVGIQNFGANIYNLTTERALLARDSSLNWFSGVFGSTLMKTNMGAVAEGTGAETRMYGVFFSGAGQHFDIYNFLDHKAPNTTGDVLFKGAVAAQGKSIFQGLINIRKVAQGTNTFLGNRNLLLAENARADSIPRLEIEAHNVRASHGVTIGQIDEEQLFYLMSRGLTRSESTRLVVEGFFESLIKRIPLAGARDRLKALITDKMER